jgi:hypothetical protein
MNSVLDILGTLPVLPFTLGLGVCLAYWVVALVAGLDLGTDGADGALDGAADGALDGAADGVVDGAADGVADGALEGAHEGVHEGLAEAAHESVAEGVVESTVAATVLSTVFPLGRVPVTVWLSLFAWWGFLLTLGGSFLMRTFASQGNVLVSLGLLGIAIPAALVLAGGSSRPLEPLFRTVGSRGRAHLIGEVAEITTGRVDARFGQARIVLGGDDLVVHVRCDRPDNGLGRGHQALVVEFDKERDAFVVEPISDGKKASLGEMKAHRARAAREALSDR